MRRPSRSGAGLPLIQRRRTNPESRVPHPGTRCLWTSATTGPPTSRDALPSPAHGAAVRAQTVHRRHHDPGTVQRCTLLSIKTGGCPEDCAYCPQSARYDTGVAARGLDGPRRAVLEAARGRRARTARRASAWERRGAKCTTGRPFDAVLVDGRGRRGARHGGLHDARDAHARAGAAAEGRRASPPTTTTSTLRPSSIRSIITTRTYQERLDTLRTSRRRASACAAAASSAWGSRRAIAAR